MQFTVATRDGQFNFSSQQPESDPSTYSIIVSGERLSFTREQLESDPNNKFSEYFFGTSSQPSTEKREMRIEKEPALFKLIQAHLRGYNIFPIRDGFVPYMTTDGVLKNLLKEAEFYALSGLVQKLQIFQKRATEFPKYMLSKYHRGGNLESHPLDEATYSALLQQVNSSPRELLSSEADSLKHAGYTISISWKDGMYHYASLVRDDTQ